MQEGGLTFQIQDFSCNWQYVHNVHCTPLTLFKDVDMSQFRWLICTGDIFAFSSIVQKRNVVILFVLLVEGKSLGYANFGLAGWREKSMYMVIIFVLLVKEKSLGYKFSGYAGWREKSIGKWLYFWFYPASCREESWIYVNYSGSTGYSFGSAGWSEKSGIWSFCFCRLKRKVRGYGYSFGSVLLVDEKSLGWLLWLCWLAGKVFRYGYFCYAGWREKSVDLVILMVLRVEEKSLGYNYSGSAGWREKSWI